jgi:GDPmannose 4,6-dehydratase
MKKSALITGITGQDGSYLAELLHAKGYRVIGAVRDIARAMGHFPSALASRIELVEWNMLDETAMVDILVRYNPTELYNFAAFSSGAGMFEDPVMMCEINGLAVTRILESIRKTDKNIRFCQASSREVFGEAEEAPQAENTRRIPRTPYGSAKLYADSMVKIYREHYGMFACSAILFNHESPRRGLEFVTRKITSGAVKIKLGLASELRLGNLDALRDWGFAGDYVYAMWQMLQQRSPDDYVLATGVTHSVREFCECAFSYLGLDYRDYVKLDSVSYRPSETTIFIGNSEKAKKNLNWMPKMNFYEMVGMMVENDLQLLGGESAAIKCETKFRKIESL